MNVCGTFIKDPDARLDYGWDFTDWLAVDETISTAVVTATDGILVEQSDILLPDSKVIAYWLSGGTAGRDYYVTAHITTDQARTDNRSHLIKCKER